MISIVIGAGWGDEGKGNVVSHLSKKPNSIVVRFNGGHQAAHNVIKDGVSHIFQSFGSGTLNGCPTYISKYCTVHLARMAKEYEVLLSKKVKPKLYIDALAKITTPMDVAYNRVVETIKRHGSVGVGVGATLKRNNETPYKLYMCDLWNLPHYRRRYEAIKNYYLSLPIISQNNRMYEEFLASEESSFVVRHDIFEIVENDSLLSDYENVIYEGAQGILLDMDHGIFPNVTYGNTTSKNAWEIIGNSFVDKEVYYVSRCYQTRHGNGWMSDERNLVLENCRETNVKSDWQGPFRVGNLDYGLVSHSIRTDKLYHQFNTNNHVVFTCCDQINFTLQRDRLPSFIDDIYMVSSPDFSKFVKTNRHD